MPHGGYHGTVVMGGNIVQQGYQKPDGSYGIKGGIGDAALNIPVNQQAQTAAEATAAAQAKKKEIELDDFPLALLDPTEYGSKGTNWTDLADWFGADDQKAKSMEFDRENQILNNLLIAQQQAANREGIIRAAQPTSTTPDGEAGGVLNKSDLLGYDGGLFGLNIGATPSDGISGIATVINPFTGEKLPTQIKAREGLTTPQYNQFIADLYDANPELYQETFPFASGQIAKPILARIGEGIMGLPGASQIGQLASSLISPLSGLFTGQSTTTPKIRYDDMGNAIGIISQAPDGGSDAQEVDKFGNTVLPMGQYSAIPEEYKGFFESEFAKPVAGGMAITYVTLPDGRRIRFGDTGSAAQFRKYLESIGAMQPEKPSGLDAIMPPKFNTGLPALTDYASMAPQFTGSQYTNQGVSPAFLENLRKFYG